MNEQTNPANWNEKAAQLRAKHSNLNHIAADLPEAARIEITSKLDQSGVMLSALERDIGELKSGEGADRTTVAELYAKTSEIINDLHYELEALASGNPTTVSAAVDATSRLVEKSGEALKTITSKIPILSQGK